MKLSRIPTKEPVTKFSVSLRATTLKTLDAYQDYCQSVTGQALIRQELIEQMLLDFMASDKDFVRAQKSPAAVAVPGVAEPAPALAG